MLDAQRPGARVRGTRPLAEEAAKVGNPSDSDSAGGTSRARGSRGSHAVLTGPFLDQPNRAPAIAVRSRVRPQYSHAPAAAAPVGGRQARRRGQSESRSAVGPLIVRDFVPFLSRLPSPAGTDHCPSAFVTSTLREGPLHQHRTASTWRTARSRGSRLRLRAGAAPPPTASALSPAGGVGTPRYREDTCWLVENPVDRVARPRFTPHKTATKSAAVDSSLQKTTR